MTSNGGSRSPGAASAKAVSAGVLLTDAPGRVLLVQRAGDPSWEIPGDSVRAGESPRAAARRALRDEVGIEPVIGSLLVLDWLPAREQLPDELMLIYDGGPLDEGEARGIRLASADLIAYGFADLGSAVGLMTPGLERRVQTALQARRIGRGVELEDGWPQIARELAVDR